MWDRTFINSPSVDSIDAPDRLDDALTDLWNQAQRAPGFVLDRVQLVRQLRRKDSRAYEQSYTQAATYSVPAEWSAHEVAQELIAGARAATLEDDENRRTTKWGVKFLAIRDGRRDKPTPGSVYFDLDELDSGTRHEPDLEDERGGLLAYYQRELGRHEDKLADERRYWQNHLAQTEHRNNARFAELEKRYHDTLTAERIRHEETHEGTLKAERARCDAEIRDKCALITEQAKQLVDASIDTVKAMGEQVKQLHTQILAHTTLQSEMAKTALDPSTNTTVQAMSTLATGVGMIQDTLKGRIKLLEDAARTANDERKHRMMENAFSETMKLGKQWLRLKHGIKIDDDDVDAFKTAVLRLLEQASVDDWAVAVELMGAEPVDRLRALTQRWDKGEAEDLLGAFTEKLMEAGEETVDRFSGTTQRNLKAVLETI